MSDYENIHEAGTIPYDETGPLIEGVSADCLDDARIFRYNKNMVWITKVQKARPKKPCPLCQVPSWNYESQWDIGTVVGCLECGALWRLVEFVESSFIIQTWWNMVVPEGDFWTVVLHDARNWRGKKVQKPWRIRSGR